MVIASATYLGHFRDGNRQKAIPLYLTIERSNLDDIVELFSWNVQMIEFLLNLTQWYWAFRWKL